MKGIVYRGIEQVALADVPDPQIRRPTDAIVRITTSAICGSDLHTYLHEVPEREGWVMGHEFIGVVEAVGPEVKKYRPGQRVVSPFRVSCGDCWFCRHGWPTQCAQAEGGAVFGQPPLHGAQAPYVRVPWADGTLEPVPEDVPDEEAIFLGDIFSTGFFCAENGGVKAGDLVAVVGCGPVGLFAQMAAHLMGAAVVMAVDRVPFRLDMARRLGSVPINAAETDAGRQVRELTEGRGADVVLEAVGADGGAFALAFQLVRPGGTVSMVGVPTQDTFPFPIRQGFRQDLTFKIGVCPSKNYIARLMPLLQQRKVQLSQIVTHTVSLEEGVAMYQRFARREPGVLKVLLRP